VQRPFEQFAADRAAISIEVSVVEVSSLGAIPGLAEAASPNVSTRR